jgi:hypothetical protein
MDFTTWVSWMLIVFTAFLMAYVLVIMVKDYKDGRLIHCEYRFLPSKLIEHELAYVCDEIIRAVNETKGAYDLHITITYDLDGSTIVHWTYRLTRGASWVPQKTS